MLLAESTRVVSICSIAADDHSAPELWLENLLPTPFCAYVCFQKQHRKVHGFMSL